MYKKRVIIQNRKHGNMERSICMYCWTNPRTPVTSIPVLVFELGSFALLWVSHWPPDTTIITFCCFRTVKYSLAISLTLAFSPMALKTIQRYVYIWTWRVNTPVDKLNKSLVLSFLWFTGSWISHHPGGDLLNHHLGDGNKYWRLCKTKCNLLA